MVLPIGAQVEDCTRARKPSPTQDTQEKHRMVPAMGFVDIRIPLHVAQQLQQWLQLQQLQLQWLKWLQWLQWLQELKGLQSLQWLQLQWLQ